MNSSIPKHIKALFTSFVVVGALGLLFMFTIGLMFFAMDVTATILMYLLFVSVPALYLVLGIFIPKKYILIWIAALILAVVPTMYGIIYVLPIKITHFMLDVIFNPSILIFAAGIVLLIQVLRPAVIKYYFSKEN